MSYRQEQPLFHSNAVWRVSVCGSICVHRSLEEDSRRRVTGQVWQCDASRNGAEGLTGLVLVLQNVVGILCLNATKELYECFQGHPEVFYRVREVVEGIFHVHRGLIKVK